MLTIYGLKTLLLLLLSTRSALAFTVSSSTTSATTSSRAKRATTTTALGPMARNGLGYEDITIGQGRRVLPGDTVSVYYEGKFQKQSSGSGGGGGPANLFGGGKKSSSSLVTFDAVTPNDGPPAQFLVGKNELVMGCDLGILGNVNLEIPPMNIGGRRSLLIPSGLAYGEEGAGPIPPNTDLEFNIEVVDARPVSDLTVGYKIKATGIVAVLVLTILSGAWFVLHNI